MTEGNGRGVALWVKGGMLFLAVAAAAGAVYWALPEEWLEEEYLDEVLQRSGMLAPVAYIAVKTAVVLVAVIPSAPLDVVSGAVFGPLLGSVYSLAGYQVGAMGCFFLARRLGRGTMASFMGKEVAFCDRCSQRHLALLIFLARLEPVFSFALVSYGAGLTGISPRAFAVSTFLGMIPATVALNFFGRSFFTGNVALQIVLGVALVLLMFVVPLWIKRKNPWGMYEKLKGGEDHRH